MILYFSGTGNSEYAAKLMAREIKDECLNLFEKLRSHDYSTLTSSRPWIVVVLTYAWRIPRIVADWLNKTELAGSKKIYFVMTCGGAIGNASAWLKKLCDHQGLEFCGCAEVALPENYIALYSAPDEEEALKIIANAETKLIKIADKINKNQTLDEVRAGIKGKLCSGPVNQAFYTFMVKADKFSVNDQCISCGQCVEVCPFTNIKLIQGKPVWGKSCTHCMACICRCPKEAIDYGKHTIGLRRYTCPKKVK